MDVYLPFDLGLLVPLGEYLMRWSTEQERPFHTAFQTTVDVVEYNVITPTFKERNIPLSRSLMSVKGRLRKILLNP